MVRTAGLFASSDFDRRLLVWMKLPDKSGAKPDVVYPGGSPGRLCLSRGRYSRKRCGTEAHSLGSSPGPAFLRWNPPLRVSVGRASDQHFFHCKSASGTAETRRSRAIQSAESLPPRRQKVLRGRSQLPPCACMELSGRCPGGKTGGYVPRSAGRSVAEGVDRERPSLHAGGNGFRRRKTLG